MAALQTVWSIDVGKSSLKAVKLHRERNSLEILAVDKVDYVVDTDGIDDVHQAREAIQTFASRNQINAPVIVAHPGHSAFSRFIQLPPVDDKKLVEMVGYEAQQQIPFPIDEVMWDYHVCDTGEAGAAMLLRRKVRRRVGAALLALGIALMLLAPESPGGWVALGLAVVLEFAGLALERGD